MEYSVKIFRLDRRTKKGARLVGTYDYNRPNDAAMEREVAELRRSGYPESQYRIEYRETYITVKSLMTGKDVTIRADTPWACRPDSETYWSS